MDLDRLFSLVVESLWAPATYAKMLFVLAMAPFWWPLAKVMYHEFLPALNASGEEPKSRPAPGMDPFLSIPLASHRARSGTPRTQAARPRAR